MGAIIGTTFCIQHSNKIDGAILWNFNVDGGILTSILKILLKIERALKGSDVPSALAMKLTFEDWNKKFKPNRTDFDWLSRDEEEVDLYVNDPDCGFPCTISLWLDVLRLIQLGASNTQLEKIRNDLPIHLLGGKADPSSDYGKSIARLANRLNTTSIADISTQLLEDTRHETLNEINRQAETQDLITWLDERFG